MSVRIALLAAVLASGLSAQFSGLSSSADGASLYFASTLRLKSLGQPLNGKIYAATAGGVSLFRARDSSKSAWTTARRSNSSATRHTSIRSTGM